MGLTVALSDTLFAEGRLYWDDGVHIGRYKTLLSWQGGQTLLQVAQRGCGASTLGDIHSPS